MAKWRKLYTKIIESHDFNEMPDDTHRLLFILIILIVCREGRGMDTPAWIKSKVMPLRLDVSDELIDSVMNWLENRGMIQRYLVNGRQYFRIISWHIHQNTKKEAESPYPTPLDHKSKSRNRNSGDNLDQLGKKSDLDQEIDKEEDENELKDTEINGEGEGERELVLTDLPRSDFNAEEVMAKMLEEWRIRFPEKAQPGPKTYAKRVADRLQDDEFLDYWQDAMFKASQSPHLHKEGWFRFEYFVRNGENWKKILDGAFDTFDEQKQSNSEPKGFDNLRHALSEEENG